MKRDLVQVLNPRTGRYVKIDRVAGLVVSHKQTAGPYKNIPIMGVREIQKPYGKPSIPTKEIRAAVDAMVGKRNQ